MTTESPWTHETLREHLLQRIDSLVTLLDERYLTQTRAIDAAFAAQQASVIAGFAAAENTAQAGLTSAREASDKAEKAYDKRFESVNEFRAQLSDQTATLISRAEYSVQHSALDDKVNAIADRVVQLDLRLTSRLDLAAGGDTQSRQAAGDRRLESAAVAQWAGMVLIGIGVIVSIVIALVLHH
jgi:predicted mannosyl-3-phosphoglycerate phosphatase (HAD superfamily)